MKKFITQRLPGLLPEDDYSKTFSCIQFITVSIQKDIGLQKEGES